VNILYLTQYFPPETGAAPLRVYYHSKKWISMGHRVTVITNVPNSPSGKIYKGFKNSFFKKESFEGITLYRILTLTAGKKSSVIRRLLSSFVFFNLSLFVVFLKGHDIVIGTAPFFAGFAAFTIGKIKGIPVIYEMRDPWLQVIAHSQRNLRFFLAPLVWIEKFAAQRADTVVVIGQNMAEYVQLCYCLSGRPDVIYNGIIPEDINKADTSFSEKIKREIRDNYVIGFIGNMGNQYDYDAVLKTALLLKMQPFKFLFVGEGSKKKYLIAQAERLNLSNIMVFDSVPYYQSLGILKSIDLTLIPLKSGAMYQIYLPLKLFDSLSMGIPVILLNNDEGGKLLKDVEGISCLQSDDEKAVARAILKYYCDRNRLRKIMSDSKQRILEQFSRSKQALKYEKIFTKIKKQ